MNLPAFTDPQGMDLLYARIFEIGGELLMTDHRSVTGLRKRNCVVKMVGIAVGDKQVTDPRPLILRDKAIHVQPPEIPPWIDGYTVFIALDDECVIMVVV